MSNALPMVRDRKEQELLIAYMESEACPLHTMNFYQLDGYLRAICSGPWMTKPDEWLPLVFNDKQPRYQREWEAEQVIAAIVNLYNFHAGQVLNDKCNLPCVPIYHTQREDRIDLEQWARGFMQGYIFWGDRWNELLDTVVLSHSGADQQPFAEKLDFVLYVIAVVADVDLALQQGTYPDDLVGIFASLPKTLISFGRIGRALCGYPLEQISSTGSS